MFPKCYLSRDFRMKMLRKRNPVLNIMNHCRTHSLALSIAAWHTRKKRRQMIEIETRQLAGIPVLHAVPAGKRSVHSLALFSITGLHLQVWSIAILPLLWLRPDSGLSCQMRPTMVPASTVMLRSECSASGIYCSKTCRSLRRYVRRWWRKIGYQMKDLLLRGRRWEA